MIKVNSGNGYKPFQYQLDDYVFQNHPYNMLIHDNPRKSLGLWMEQCAFRRARVTRPILHAALGIKTQPITLTSYCSPWIRELVPQPQINPSQPINRQSSRVPDPILHHSLLEYHHPIQNAETDEPRFRRHRFPPVPAVIFEDHAKGRISEEEWLLFQEIPKFRGIFQDIFLLNPLPDLDCIQEHNPALFGDFRGTDLHDIFVWEFYRVNAGLPSYERLDDIASGLDLQLFQSILHFPNRFPSAAVLSYTLNQISKEDFLHFFRSLVLETFALKLVNPYQLLGDGFFVHSRANNYKDTETQKYRDPDAGLVVHDGRFLGLGYYPVVLAVYTPEIWLPIYFQIFPANISEKISAPQVFKAFLKEDPYHWELANYDGGIYSAKNIEILKDLGLSPVIKVPKNLTSVPIREVAEDVWMLADEFPKSWSAEQLHKLYKVRAVIEQIFSNPARDYGGKRLNCMGHQGCMQFMTFNMSLIVLKALAAFKVNRPDLALKSSAFKRLKY